VIITNNNEEIIQEYKKWYFNRSKIYPNQNQIDYMTTLLLKYLERKEFQKLSIAQILDKIAFLMNN